MLLSSLMFTYMYLHAAKRGTNRLFLLTDLCVSAVAFRNTSKTKVLI
jgi:hypothetical protein